MESPKTKYAHYHPENRYAPCYCEKPWANAAPKTLHRPEVSRSAWVEELERRVAAAYAEVQRAEYVARNAERILDEAREKWEVLIFELKAEGSSTAAICREGGQANEK